MVGIVQIGNGNSQGLDTSSWSILTSGYGHFNRLGAVKAALDIIVNLGGALTEVCPAIRGVGETMFVCSFGAPNYTCAGS